MPDALDRLKRRLEAREARLRTVEGELERERALSAARARQLGGFEDRLDAQATELQRRGELLAQAHAAIDALRAGDFGDAALPPVVGWWQSPVIAAELRRRLTGDPSVAPETYFLRTHLSERAPRALLVGAASPRRAWRARQQQLCEHVVCVDCSAERVAAAEQSLSDLDRRYVQFIAEDVSSWRPAEPFQLVVVGNALQERDDLESWAAGVCAAVAPGGWLYIDDTINPPAPQLGGRADPGDAALSDEGHRANHEIDVAQRVLDRLSPALRTDVYAGDGRVRDRVVPAGVTDDEGRRRLDELLAGLSAGLEPVEVKPYGGALIQRLFTAIMGNFAGYDDLVRVITELDSILTDHAVIPSSWIWGVYRRDGVETA